MCSSDLKLGSRESNQEAIGECRRAVELDPNFAPGWDLLGDTLRVRYVAFGAGGYKEDRDEAHAAIQKAIDLDPKRP